MQSCSQQESWGLFVNEGAWVERKAREFSFVIQNWKRGNYEFLAAGNKLSDYLITSRF